MNTNNAELLSAALTGLLIKKRELDAQIKIIQDAIDGASYQATAGNVVDKKKIVDYLRKVETKSSHRGRKTMSPAARKRIADAQKKRWAKYRKEQKANAANAAE